MIDMKIKKFFFDRAPVQRALREGKMQFLRQSALTIRKIARNSMKAGIVRRGRGAKRKDTSRNSPPGKPPYYFTRKLKDYLFAGFDFNAGVADIGPVKITTAAGKGGEAPRLLEFGGNGTLYVGKRKIRARWRPHPYMEPALAKEREKMPARWAGSVRST